MPRYSDRKFNLKRFKTSLRGRIEFAALIEQAPPGRAEKFLREARARDPEFIELVMQKVVFFDELIYLDEEILSEILCKTSPRLLAFALADSEETFRRQILRHLGYVEMRKFLDEEIAVAKLESKRFRLGAQRQILKIGRELEAQDKFIFEILGAPRLRNRT